MSAEKLLDGKKLSEELNQKLKQEIQESFKSTGIKPKLATILVGENPASQIYIRIKHKTCEFVGIESISVNLDKTITKEQLLSEIRKLNDDSSIHGILLQLPVPDHLKGYTSEFISEIKIEKDVDGLHPQNAGNLFNYNEDLAPCTPKGIIALLENYEVEIQGKDVTIINRSNLVGKPLIFMFLKRNATVSVCHTKTRDIDKHIKNADILIVAVGVPNFITAERVKEDVVVIDVGTNRVEGKLCGDVNFDDVFSKVKKITPVPGGVGPMTVHMLMENTYNAYKNTINIK